MPGMTATFILITFLLSPCCQLLCSSLTAHSGHQTARVHVVTMSPQTVFLTLLLCLSVFSSSSSPAKKPGCFRVNNCKCIMKDGSGVINLGAMGDDAGFLGYLRPVSAENMPVDAEVLLSFSPCQPLSQPEDLMGADCTSMAACIIVRYHRLNRHISCCISFGRHEGNEFHYNHSLKTLSVSYFGEGTLHHTDGSVTGVQPDSQSSPPPAPAHREQPLTVVHYHCSPNQSTSFIQDQRLSTEESLQIWVESPCACPNACTMGDLGLGTIFLIILSLSAAAYFVLGNALTGVNVLCEA